MQEGERVQEGERESEREPFKSIQSDSGVGHLPTFQQSN